MTKLAVIDLDGVVADSTERFKRAEKARDAFLQEAEARFETVLHEGTTNKKATDIYWRTAFTPELVALDTLIEGADEAIETLENFYQVFYLTSRPETMREATRTWLVEHELAGPRLVMKSSAFQYTKTTIWKAGMVQTLASLYGASNIVFIDDQEETHEALRQATDIEGLTRLRCCTSLKEAVEALREEK